MKFFGHLKTRFFFWIPIKSLTSVLVLRWPKNSNLPGWHTPCHRTYGSCWCWRDSTSSVHAEFKNIIPQAIFSPRRGVSQLSLQVSANPNSEEYGVAHCFAQVARHVWVGQLANWKAFLDTENNSDEENDEANGSKMILKAHDASRSRPRNNVGTWNTLLWGLCKSERLGSPSELFKIVAEIENKSERVTSQLFPPLNFEGFFTLFWKKILQNTHTNQAVVPEILITSFAEFPSESPRGWLQ